MASNNKSVHKKRHKSTKSEYEYVKGIVHNLSFQRWTAQEISDYLKDEKGIELSRSRISRIKNQVERKAEKWYMELRQSRYKFIAIYKERIDSLFSYQKKLHQIIDFYIQPPNQMLETDTVIRAISELHKIEISIFSLWKQLPDLGYSTTTEEQTTTATTSTLIPFDPRPTTYPTIPDPDNPGKWMTDPAWIEENMRKMKENSNLDYFKDEKEVL